MRNVLLGLSIALVLLNGKANAQIMTQSGKDSVSGAYDGNTTLSVYNRIKSASSTAPVYLKWNVIAGETHFGTGWDMMSTGVCDNIICHMPNTSTGDNLFVNGKVQKTDAYDHTTFNGLAHDFHVMFSTPTTPPNGTSAIVRIAARDTVSGDQRTLTFIGYKSSTGVSTINSSDDVILYPIPAKEALNVVFDGKAGIKTLAVYNLVGKLMGPIYKPASNFSAKIALDDMPTGVYFLRLIDGEGKVVATRRFTHQ